VEQRREELEVLGRRLARVHPRRLLEGQGQRLDDIEEAVRRAARRGLKESRVRLDMGRRGLSLARPRERVARENERVEELRRRLSAGAARLLRMGRERLRATDSRLGLLSPLAVLERGYSITTDAATGAVLRDAAGLKPGQRVATVLARGVVHGVVTRVERGDAAP
jgi:exodeoxyribonuclease VII large subunit